MVGELTSYLGRHGDVKMQIIECPNVDLISPFPEHEVPRLRKWMYCYKSLIIDDSRAGTEEQFEKYLHESILSPAMKTFGIIDKNNITQSWHEAPLIGFVSLERTSPYNAYFHVASSRSCWGKGLMDEAGMAVLKLVFESDDPTLQRVSAAILDKNSPAKGLAYRCGMVKEGKFPAFILQNGQPMTVVHFGITKDRWNELCQWQSQPQSE